MNQLNCKRKAASYGVALAITASALTGCGDQLKDFSYKTVTGGAIEIEGVISYNKLAASEVIKVTNIQTNQENFFLCKEVEKGHDIAYCRFYIDIESGKTIISLDSSLIPTDTNLSYQEYGSVKSFLAVSENIKNTYTGEDVKNIKESIVESIKKEETNKVFEKTN